MPKPRSNTEQKKSRAVYVRFRANDEQSGAILDVFGVQAGNEPVSVLIWTTTPWTLPANVAIALRDEASYGLYRVDGELLIVAEALAPKALGDRFADAVRVATVTGEKLDGLAVRHPFMDRDSAIVLAGYVDLEMLEQARCTPGTAPTTSTTGMKYGLPIAQSGRCLEEVHDEAGPYAGMHIFKANNTIVEDLRTSGALWSDAEFEHSYPHCWRCHNPVIFRATAQWFIAMDQNLLRRRAVDAVDGVAYTPDWGRTRQRQMIETHPEWCISRQRTWGTPIPAVICTSCNESILDPRVARNAAKRFGEVGASAWWSDPVETYLPDGFVCSRCGGTTFEKEKNIVDIWFRSGVSRRPVLGTRRPECLAERRCARRRRSIPRLVPQLAAHRGCHQRACAVSPRRQERLGERRARPRDVQIDRHRHHGRRRNGEVGCGRSTTVDRIGGVF